MVAFAHAPPPPILCPTKNVTFLLGNGSWCWGGVGGSYLKEKQKEKGKREACPIQEKNTPKSFTPNSPNQRKAFLILAGEEEQGISDLLVCLH